jgi:hypothetical protein
LGGRSTPAFETAIWVNTYTKNGDPVGQDDDPLWEGYSLPIGTPQLTTTGQRVAFNSIALSRAVAVDSGGNVVLAGGYCGALTFVLASGGSQVLSTPNCSPSPLGWTSPNGIFVAKLSRQGAVWVRSLADGHVNNDGLGNQLIDSSGLAGMSLVVDNNDDDIVLLTLSGSLRKLAAGDGSVVHVYPDAKYSVAAVDAQDNVYASGYLVAGQDLGCPGDPIISVTGLPPFLAKYSARATRESIKGGGFKIIPAGTCLWLSHANTVCPADAPPNCGGSPTQPSLGRPQVEGVSIGFDPAGNAILGSFGNPVQGGGIDFGVGTFPTYHSNNIFLSAYSPAGGTLLWAQQIPTILSSFLLGMTPDRQGRVVMSGNYSGSMQVDDHLLVTAVPEQPGVIDSFLASFTLPSLSDTTAPTIGVIVGVADPADATINTVPKHIVSQATSSAGAQVFFMPPTASDTGNAGASVLCSPRPNTTFPIGTTPVTCTATDPLGNHSSASFTVTVADQLAPLFSPYADIKVRATSVGGANVPYPATVGNPAGPTAIDQVDGAITPVCVPPSASVFPIGKTTVTCSAHDLSGNKSKASFVVNVEGPVVGGTCTQASDCLTGNCVDGVCCSGACGAGAPPVVVVPANITADAISSTGVKVAFSATATDWHGASLTPTCTPASGTTFAIGTKTVTCKATDQNGLTGTASFSVTVRLRRAPPSTTSLGR